MADPETEGPAAAPPGAALPGGPAAAAGPESAAWVREHLDAVYRYARRRLSAADAEDVAQQAFVGLFRAEAAGRPPEDAGAYLLGAARRRVADLFRRRAAQRSPVALPPAWERFADEPLPDEALASRELADLVHVALGLLAPSERSLLLLRYREGLAVAEIAAREAATPKAIEMRLHRARRAFRERFREVGGDWTAEEPGVREAVGGEAS
jgi:RNA polymerase sigma-70 factor (ECF subfamily)